MSFMISFFFKNLCAFYVVHLSQTPSLHVYVGIDQFLKLIKD